MFVCFFLCLRTYVPCPCAAPPLTVELRFTGLDKSTAFIQHQRKDCKIAVAKGQIKSDKYFYFHLLHVASSL